MKDVALFGGNALTYVLSAIQQNEVFQIIEFVLAILTSIILIAYRLWVWYKKAKADGKITKEEIEEGLEILGEGIEDLKEKTDELKKGENDNAKD